MPRIAAITTQSALPPEHRAAAAAVLDVFGHIRGPFSVLLHSPQLAEQLLPLVTFVRHGNIVDARLRFTAILAAVREAGAQYVWAAQVEQARRNGIREDLIELLRTRADSVQFASDEAGVVEYVRQLVRGHRVDQSTFDALEEKYSVQWLVELTAVVSFFGFVSTICNAFEVEPPPGGDRLPA